MTTVYIVSHPLFHEPFQQDIKKRERGNVLIYQTFFLNYPAIGRKSYAQDLLRAIPKKTSGRAVF